MGAMGIYVDIFHVYVWRKPVRTNQYCESVSGLQIPLAAFIANEK